MKDYKTNLGSMWETRSIMNKLLNVLLKLHLAPQREAAYNKYISKKKETALKECQEKEEKLIRAKRCNIENLSRDRES